MRGATTTVERLTLTDRALILDKLLGQVFHVTTREAYKGILKAAEISNNASGRFPVNTSSGSSYGRLQGYICFFDLRDHTPEIIQKTLECYYFLGPSWFSKIGTKYITYDLAYLILSPRYYDQLIPNARAYEHSRHADEQLMVIPGSEIWVNDHVPMTWIGKILLVTVKESLPDANTPSGRYFLAVLKADLIRRKGKMGE